MSLTKFEERMVKKAIRDLDNADDRVWDYFSGEPLLYQDTRLNIKLVLVGRMDDPVAVFRPQTLFSYYGEARVGSSISKVLLVVGTDEGLTDVEICVGSIEKLQRKVNTKMYKMISKILPKDLTG
jgi:hypothetical protein